MTGSPKLSLCSEQNVIMFKILNPGKHFYMKWLNPYCLFVLICCQRVLCLMTQSLTLIIVIKYIYYFFPNDLIVLKAFDEQSLQTSIF